MNTRSFLKSLAIACVAPQVLIARAPDAYRWVRSSMINPAWVDAEYECWFATFEPSPAYIGNLIHTQVWVHHRDSVTQKVDHKIPATRYVLNRETGLFEKQKGNACQLA